MATQLKLIGTDVPPPALQLTVDWDAEYDEIGPDGGGGGGGVVSVGVGVGVGDGLGVSLGVDEGVGVSVGLAEGAGVPVPRVSSSTSRISTARSSAPPIEARMMSRRRDLPSAGAPASGSPGETGAPPMSSVGASPAASNFWVGVSSLMGPLSAWNGAVTPG